MPLVGVKDALERVGGEILLIGHLPIRIGHLLHAARRRLVLGEYNPSAVNGLRRHPHLEVATDHRSLVSLLPIPPTLISTISISPCQELPA
jgi:hypothetical protein